MTVRPDPAILVADDNPADVAAFRRAFTELALSPQLRAVPNGAQAIAYLAGSGKFANRAAFPMPELFLLDLDMPLKSGFEVLQWLRTRPSLAHIRTVVLTASLDLSNIKKAYRCGAASFLVKPLNLQEFRDTINAFYDFWRATQPPHVQAGKQHSCDLSNP